MAIKYSIDKYSPKAQEAFDSLRRTIGTYDWNAWRVGNA